MHAHRQFDEAWLDRAQYRVEVSGDLPASAARVFDVLADPEPWPQWLRIVRRVEYLTGRPFGVGTERDVFSHGAMIREHFYRWEAAERFSFYVRESTVPGLVAFAEDYRLTPTGDDSCRLTWKTSFDLSWWARPGGALGRAFFAREAALGVRRLASWLESH